MSERTLRYFTTRAEFIAKLHRYAGRSSAARWFPPVTYAVIVALSWLSAILFYVRQGDKNHLYVLSGMFALFLTVSLPWLYRRYQDSFFASVLTDAHLRGLVGAVELVIREDSIEERGDVASVHSSWREIDSIDVDREHIVIVVAPLIAIIVPASAFADETARLAIAAELKKKLDASRA